VLAALEVDDPVAALVAAALVARGDAAVDVAAAGLRDRRRQRLLRRGLRDLLERGHAHEPASWRSGLVFLQCHQTTDLWWFPMPEMRSIFGIFRPELLRRPRSPEMDRS